MADFIIVLVLLIIVGGASLYVIKTKKNGVKCIGCPSAGICSHGKGKKSECGCE